MTHLLIASGDPSRRRHWAGEFTRGGMKIDTTGSAATLWHWISAGEGEVALVEANLPDSPALPLLERIAQRRPDLRLGLIGRSPARAMPDGIAVWPSFEAAFNILLPVAGAADPASNSVPAAGDGGRSLPVTATMQEVSRLLDRAARDTHPILITGPLGVGKTRLARSIPTRSGRHGPLIIVDLTTFVSADHERLLTDEPESAWSRARGGTLVLREVPALTEAGQRLLMRRLSAEGDPETAVRLITTARADLATVPDFRDDLRLQLEVNLVHVPALAERREDIPVLVRFFGEEPMADVPELALDESAMAELISHDWPGNLRELKQLCRRLRHRLDGRKASAADIAAEFRRTAPVVHDLAGLSAHAARGSLSESIEAHLEAYFSAHGDELPPPGLYQRILVEVERPMLARALAATRGNQLRAASLLGLNRNTLRKKLRDLGMERSSRRGAGS